jgi:hypothetical protein
MQESDLLPIISEAMYLTQKKHEISISRDRDSFTISVTDSKGATTFCENMIELLIDQLEAPRSISHKPTEGSGGADTKCWG